MVLTAYSVDETEVLILSIEADLAHAKIDLIGFNPQPKLTTATVEDARRELAKSLVGSQIKDESIIDVIKRAIASDFAHDRTVLVDGWMLSLVESKLLVYAAMQHANAGTSPRIERRTAETAIPGNIAQVKAWGPQATCSGVGFNVQSDGHSSLWITFSGSAPVGLSVLLNGLQVKTTQSAGILTTRIEGEQFSRLFGSAGDVVVEIYDPNQGAKQSVGVFKISGGVEFAVTESGAISTVFRKVHDWGPKFTKRLTSFNSQGGETSAFWIKTSCAPITTLARLGDTDLFVTVSSDLITISLDGLSPLSKSGKVPLRLVDSVSGEVVLVGEFQILE